MSFAGNFRSLTPVQRNTFAACMVATGDADAIALARGILFDPRWPWHAAAHLGAKVHAANQYLRSQPARFKSLFDA